MIAPDRLDVSLYREMRRIRGICSGGERGGSLVLRGGDVYRERKTDRER